MAFWHYLGKKSGKSVFFFAKIQALYMPIASDFSQKSFGIVQEQVTRGHNIIVDGWAGASKPHRHPMLPLKLTYTSSRADGWTE